MVCVNKMPGKKDISHDLREAIVAAINLGRVRPDSHITPKKNV